MEEAKVISCQLIFYPLETAATGKAVNRILKIIEDSGLEFETNPVATTLYGSSEQIFALLQEINDKSNQAGIKYALDINISNKCGCQD